MQGRKKKCKGNTERQSPSLKGSTRERRSSSTLPTGRRQANECEKQKGRVEVDGEWEEEGVGGGEERERKRERARGDRLG